MGLCVLALGCATQQRTQRAFSGAACGKPRYVLSVHPRTIVSNERHRLGIQAAIDACGRRAPAPHARVRLGRHLATTDARGRVTINVLLPSGRYVVGLFVQRGMVARTRLSAIPNVSG